MSIDNRSQKEKLQELPQAERLKFLQSLTDEEAEALLYDWKFNGRNSQVLGGTLWQAPDRNDQPYERRLARRYC